jgi:hypothetical protein
MPGLKPHPALATGAKLVPKATTPRATVSALNFSLITILLLTPTLADEENLAPTT